MKKLYIVGSVLLVVAFIGSLFMLKEPVADFMQKGLSVANFPYMAVIVLILISAIIVLAYGLNFRETTKWDNRALWGVLVSVCYFILFALSDRYGVAENLFFFTPLTAIIGVVFVISELVLLFGFVRKLFRQRIQG